MSNVLTDDQIRIIIRTGLGYKIRIRRMRIFLGFVTSLGVTNDITTKPNRHIRWNKAQFKRYGLNGIILLQEIRSVEHGICPIAEFTSPLLSCAAILAIRP